MSLEQTWQYKHSLKMRPACDRVLSYVFNITPDRIERFNKQGDKEHPFAILDKEMAIDMRIKLMNGSFLTGQEKALSHEFYCFRTFTMEFYQNRHTREPGEFFHIASQFYLHGYADKSASHFIEWKVINLLDFMAWLKNNSMDWFKQRIRSDTESRASFFYIPYDEIPRRYFFAEWKRATSLECDPNNLGINNNRRLAGETTCLA